MRRGGRRIKTGSFASVIRAYLTWLAGEAEEGQIRQATYVNYRRELELAERPEILGELPAAQARPALIQQFLDGLAHLPGKQHGAKTALSALQRWALVRDLLPFPIMTGTQIVGSQGGHVPWTDDQVAFGEANASPPLARFITLAANTGQRGSDIVRMRWSDLEVYRGRLGINVVQRKTGLQIWVPVTMELQAALETWDRRPTYILLNPDGTPFTRPELSNRWLRERNRTPALAALAEAGLVLHGLRGTAVVRLRRSGASIPLICDMVGMSSNMVTRYCRFSSQRDNALAGVVYLDRTSAEQRRSKRDET